MDLGNKELYAQLWMNTCAIEGEFTCSRVVWSHDEAERVAKSIRIPALVFG